MNCKVTLNGKEEILTFNQYALEIFTQYADIGVQSSILYAVIYSGLRGEHYLNFGNKEKFAYSFKEVCGFVDNANEEELHNATIEFANCTAWQNQLKRVAKTINEKKKMMKKDTKKPKKK